MNKNAKYSLQRACVLKRSAACSYRYPARAGGLLKEANWPPLASPGDHSNRSSCNKWREWRGSPFKAAQGAVIGLKERLETRVQPQRGRRGRRTCCTVEERRGKTKGSRWALTGRARSPSFVASRCEVSKVDHSKTDVCAARQLDSRVWKLKKERKDVQVQRQYYWTRALTVKSHSHNLYWSQSMNTFKN